ncbi:hypothetical protein ACI78R_07795 [Geodermatophilus sp. SYSU D01106]
MTSTARHTTTHGRCAVLQANLDEIADVLVEHGYLDDALTPADAMREMAADAAEAQRAREVLFGDEVLDEQYDIAVALQEAIDVAAEHQQMVDLLGEYQVGFGGEPILEVVETLVSTAAEVERVHELLLDDGRMQDDEDVPRAVQALIAETAGVRKLLIDSGHLS